MDTDKPDAKIFSLVEVRKKNEVVASMLEEEEVNKEEFRLGRVEDALSSSMSMTGFLVEEIRELMEKAGTKEKKELIKKFGEKWEELSELFTEYWMNMD